MPTLAVTMGDPGGIGPEIILKALAQPALRRQARWLLIGEAERRLTAAMVGNGQALEGLAGVGAVEEWVKPRQAEVERIRAAIHEIAGSGLTLSKLSVAASLLGDLARD